MMEVPARRGLGNEASGARALAANRQVLGVAASESRRQRGGRSMVSLREAVCLVLLGLAS